MAVGKHCRGFLASRLRRRAFLGNREWKRGCAAGLILATARERTSRLANMSDQLLVPAV